MEQGPSAKLFAQPSHPYSLGLLSSVLLPNPKLKRETQIRLEGEIPSPIDLPKACYLASRCPLVQARCRERMPGAESVGPGHLVRCYRHDEVARHKEAVDYFARFQEQAECILGAGMPPRETRASV
jgi:oligopeptide/dipeptide ABC transporter ATP-binding protein